MAAQYSTSVDQTIPAGGSAVFDLAPVPCRQGLIYHREGGAQFRLASPSILGYGRGCGCSCCGTPTANYVVSFHGNVGLPEGAEIIPITLALALDGEVDPDSVMESSPATAEVYNSVGTEVVEEVPWICRCGSVSLRNTSTAPIVLRAGATITFDFAGICR